MTARAIISSAIFGEDFWRLNLIGGQSRSELGCIFNAYMHTLIHTLYTQNTVYTCVLEKYVIWH